MRLPEHASAAAVLLHPHPTAGGDMHSLVTSILAEGLPAEEVAVLRFNFRGVGRSGGSHEGGVGERLDGLAAIDALAARVPAELPLALVGWSFGADVALTVDHPRLCGWVAIAPPMREAALDEMVAADDSRPKLLVVPARDQFNPPEKAEPQVASWVNTTVEVIPGADHFLVGRGDRVITAVTNFLSPR
jgi:alpha/beta superfamily hydrolase